MVIERLLASLAADGRDFERLCLWLLENVPEYRSRLERVWLWRDWPGRERRPDAGIDLVAQERGGGLWAIQAKHYDRAYAIKKADLDSFLSESSRKAFTYRLLIATTDHLGVLERPSVVIFRLSDERPVEVNPRLAAVINERMADLESGALVLVEDARYRVRKLPIRRE